MTCPLEAFDQTSFPSERLPRRKSRPESIAPVFNFFSQEFPSDADRNSNCLAAPKRRSESEKCKIRSAELMSSLEGVIVTDWCGRIPCVSCLSADQRITVSIYFGVCGGGGALPRNSTLERNVETFDRSGPPPSVHWGGLLLIECGRLHLAFICSSSAIISFKKKNK